MKTVPSTFQITAAPKVEFLDSPAAVGVGETTLPDHRQGLARSGFLGDAARP